MGFGRVGLRRLGHDTVALVVAPAGAAHGGKAGGGHALAGQESRSPLPPACQVGLKVLVGHTPRL